MSFDITIVLNIALSMFLVMLVGYFLRKINMMDVAFSKKISKIVLQVTQPVLIVTSMMKMKYSVENTKLLGKILLVSVLVHTLASVFGYVTMRFMKQEDQRKLSEHSIIFANVLFFGLPIVEAMFGSDAATWASFFSIIFHIFSWTYGLIILGRGRDDIKLNLKKIIFNFGSVPCMIGIVMYFLSLELPVGIMNAANYMAGLCTPVSLLVLGGVLSTLPLKKLFTNLKVYYVCFMKLIVFPLIVFMISKYILGLDLTMSMFMMVMAGLPTASLTNMFAELYDIEPGYAATCVGMTTVFAVATLPFIVWAAQAITAIL